MMIPISRLAILGICQWEGVVGQSAEMVERTVTITSTRACFRFVSVRDGFRTVFNWLIRFKAFKRVINS